LEALLDLCLRMNDRFNEAANAMMDGAVLPRTHRRNQAGLAGRAAKPPAADSCAAPD
jgi:hypothetical protein